MLPLHPWLRSWHFKLMSNFVISLLISAGSGAWLYNKFTKRSGGGNNGPAVIGAIVCAVILFIVLLLALNTFVKH